MYVRPSTYLIQILKLFETLSTRPPRLYGINVKSNFAGWQQTIHAKIFFWKWYMMLFKFNLAHSPHMFPKNIWYLFCFAAMIFVQIMRLISHLIPPLADQIYPAMISNYKTMITFKVYCSCQLILIWGFIHTKNVFVVCGEFFIFSSSKSW